MLEKFDDKVDRMPQPEFIEVSSNSNIAFTSHAQMPIALTTSWQWALAEISQALILKQSREIINLLVADVDCVQLINNAINDIQYLIRQPIDENALVTIQTQITSVKNLVNEYICYSHINNGQIDNIINEFSMAISQLQNLEILGVGAFMLVSGLQLALLQEQAKLDIKQWSRVKAKAINYSEYAAGLTPKLFQLTVGRIDKKCNCKKWKSKTEKEIITEYECRYYDGKDLHIFREYSPNVIRACNKHRLQMFHNVTNKVNCIAVRPIREASDKWQELAVSI